jgi:hypothetical protein
VSKEKRKETRGEREGGRGEVEKVQIMDSIAVVHTINYR